MRTKMWDSPTFLAVARGLCWGLSAPLLLTTQVGEVVALARVALPLCLTLSLAIQFGAVALLERRGLTPHQAHRRVGHLLLPSWILGFAPIALLIPAGNLPLFLTFIAFGLVVYRARRLFFGAVPAILLLVFMVGWIVFFQGKIVHDAFQYYGYLVSVALDGDLELYNQIFIHNADRFYNPFPLNSARYLGTAAMQAPFFGVGHIAATALNAMGHDYALNGYSLPYRFFVSLASGLFGLGGLVLCYFLVRDFFSRRVALMALISIWLASPLIFFMYSWTGWAHPFAFFFGAAFLLAWHRTRPERRIGSWLLLGVLAGLLCLVRPANAIILLFPVLEWFMGLRAPRRLAHPRRALMTGPALCFAAAAIVFSPQLALWHAISGSWFAAPYKEVGDYHTWLRPDFVGTLFSSAQHGLFAWTPLLIVASFGLMLLWRRDRLLAVASIGSVVGTIYLYASWSIWWSGIGFSNRFFIGLTPFFVLGLAAAIAGIARVTSREWAWSILLFAMAWNLTLVADYRSNILPQGIADPHRVVDTPLDIGRLVSSNLRSAGGVRSAPSWQDWISEGFVTGRVLDGFRFRNFDGLPTAMLACLLVALMAWALLRLFFSRRARGFGNAATWSTVSAALLLTVALHGTIGFAGTRTGPRGNFHRLKNASQVAQYPAEEIELYPDYTGPISSLDLLTALNYGHAIEQGAAVARVTIVDAAGEEFSALLRAGIDTAEASYLRPEYRSAIRHDIAATEIVRDRPSHVYSSGLYDMLTYRSVVELPRPMVVRQLRIAYLHPIGRLVVTDVFMRDFG